MPGIAQSVALSAFTIMSLFGARKHADPLPAPASGRIETFEVSMPELSGRKRTIRVYLPVAYDPGTARYPVLYLQDAQQLFAPGPFGDWQIDETLDRLTARSQSNAIIVVGIDNGAHRWDEYSPWANQHMHDWIEPSWAKPSEGGEGDAYLDFLTNTLKPQIDRKYRTMADREYTGIGGSSMGGLIALYAGLTRPQVFSKVMAMSTAVWFAEDGGPWLSSNRLVRYAERHALPTNVRFYLDVGSNERSREAEPGVRDNAGRPVTYARVYVEGSEAAAGALQRGGVPDENLRFIVDPGATHSEVAWAKRFEQAVLWLYR